MAIDCYLKTIFISLSSLFLISNPATAQLIPDNTLGRDNSRIVPTRNSNRDNIAGGATRGANLFHSFQEFNVNPGREVYFNNPAGVQNILTRVTGANVSNILGTLGVDGNANLYLINPNGIFFGNDAKLDIRGSFVGTTADGIKLGTNDFYSATNPSSSKLLSVQPGALFTNAIKPTPRIITNQGNLQVEPNQNITLSADGINNNGSLIAPSGNIFLEAIDGDIVTNIVDTSDAINGGGDIFLSAAGNITINRLINASGRDFTIDDSGNLQLLSDAIANSGNVNLLAGNNITFNAESDLIADGIFGGAIAIKSGNNLTVNNGTIGSDSVGNIIGKGGDITIEANAISLVDTVDFRPCCKGIRSQTIGAANAGNIKIDTLSFRLNGAVISTSTAGSGQGGNIDITAESIELTDTNNINITSGIFSVTEAGGNAGNITIKTNSLHLNEAIISTSTAGSGQGGNIDITAESIELIAKDESPAVIAAETGRRNAGNAGNAGNITIKTNSLHLNEARISTSTSSSGQGGNIDITAKEIEVIGVLLPDNLVTGGIVSETGGVGNSGDIFINTGNLLLINGGRISTLAFTGSSGNSGTIIIFADNIKLQNNSLIVISNGGTGASSNIIINANALNLDRGFILAESNNTRGGNIEIDLNEILTLNNSAISAGGGFFAGRVLGGSGGEGNITINSPVIVAFPRDNFIAAQALGGNGGKININTNAIFGYPKFLTITADSQLAIDGEVNINGIDNKIARGAIALPSSPLSAEDIIANDICEFKNDRIARGSSFTIVGKGGIAPNPLESLEEDRTFVEWTKSKDRDRIPKLKKTDALILNQKQLQQAVGWGRKNDGTVVLTANSRKLRSSKSNLIDSACQEQ